MDAIDYGAMYRETREGMSTFVANLDDSQLATPLPAAPEWTAREALAHVTGICADILSGNLTDVGSDAWTAAHVNARSGLSISEIVEEWAETGPQIETMAAAAGPEMASLIISDLATHDLDTRGAFGDTSTRDSATAALLFDSYARNLTVRLDAAGAPALRLIADGEQHVAGTGEPAATVTTSRFELIRALSGRRCADQIRAYGWEGDPEAYLGSFAQYPMRETPLDE